MAESRWLEMTAYRGELTEQRLYRRRQARHHKLRIVHVIIGFHLVSQLIRVLQF